MNDLTMDLHERLRMAPPEIHRRLIEFLARGIEEQWRKEIATEPGSRPSDVIEVVDLAARIEVVTKAEAMQVFTGELERCETLQDTAALLQWNTSWINKLSAGDEEQLNDIVVARQEVFTADSRKAATVRRAEAKASLAELISGIVAEASGSSSIQRVVESMTDTQLHRLGRAANVAAGPEPSDPLPY